MLRGLYTAASGMEMQSMQQKVVADNLANVNTNGFKPSVTIYKAFKDQVISQGRDGKPIGVINRGVTPYTTYFDFEQGSLRQTGNPLDIAINGKGFYAVQDPQGNIQYSRNGHFTLDAAGFMTNDHGDNLLDAGLSPIYIGNEGIQDVTCSSRW